ncbi:condensation domain-containing protein [Rhizohabitans arisaemae]|uniref:condensation domain-containing protein n=1 Tax=Rhizohabitans arisaemae TaxID=2720610 RepID=UPI0024B1CD32|nr:condensation domain-containing protein [Rhizohabitans arisaemae]
MTHDALAEVAEGFRRAGLPPAYPGKTSFISVRFQALEQLSVIHAPLTFGQLSLWRSIQRLPPEVCNLPQIWALPDGASLPSVEQALEALEERHESLRTRYEPDGAGGLVQAIWQPASVCLEPVEGGDDPARTAEEAAERTAADPFDLVKDRPWRACVITSQGAPVRLVICFHHIAVDAWAINQLHREFRVLVDGMRLPEPAPTCRELAAEQWSAARQNRRKSARKFWGEIFQAAPAMEREPGLDGPEGAAALSTRWAQLGSEEAAEAANRIADRLEVSPPSVVLAAFCLAVHRRTGRDRLLVAVYTNNRTDPRWETLVAAQNQVVPLVVAPEPGEDFDTLVRRVHWDSFRAYRHGAYNVDDVLELGREYGYRGSVNGCFDGSVSGYFRYFFNYLGEYQQEHTSADRQLRTGTGGRNIGAPFYLQVQDGKALTCTLRENSVGTGFDEVTGLLLLLRDIVIAAGGPG